MLQDNYLLSILQQKVSFFSPGNLKYYSKIITVKEAIDLFKAEYAKEQTEYIRDQWREGIKEDWKTLDKKPYQEYKKRSLQAVTFTGIGNRNENPTGITGILTLDIDGNTPELLDKFYTNPPKFSLMEAQSVSGYPNGFCLACTTASTLEELEICAKAIKIYIQEHYKLKILKPDIKRIRYISYDDSIKVNDRIKPFELDLAKDLLREEAKRVQKEDSLGDQIKSNDWIEFCLKFATLKKTKWEKGQKHMFLNNYSICANLLGVPLDQLLSHLKAEYDFDKDNTNAVVYPYETYSDSFGRWDWRLTRKDLKEVVELLPDQYLIDIDTGDLKGKIVWSDTGTGKTYWAVHNSRRLIIAVPYSALCDNIASEYSIYPFMGKRELEGRPSKIVVTYASLQRLLGLLGSVEDYDFFLDEAHNLTLSSSRSFMHKQMSFILYKIKDQAFKSTTLLSGTWLYNIDPFIRKMEIIRVTKKIKQKSLYYHNADNTLATTISLASSEVQSGKFVFILQNNKGAQRQKIINRLNSKYNFASFSSESKTDQEYKSITENSRVDSSFDGLITTTVLKEGNNINNHYDFSVIILGNYHSSEIEQVSKRFRNAKSIDIHIIRSTNSVKKIFVGTAEAFANDLLKEAQQVAKDLSYISKFDLEIQKKISDFPFIMDGLGNAQVDTLLVSNQAIMREAICEWQNRDLQIKNLEQYQTKFVKEYDSHLNILSTNQDKIDAELRKQVLLMEFEQGIEEIEAQANPSRFCREQIRSKSYDLYEGQKIAYQSFIKMVGYATKEVILSNMKKIGPTKSKLKTLNLSLIFSAAYYSSKAENKVKELFEHIESLNIEYSDSKRLCFEIILKCEELGFKADKLEREYLKHEKEGVSTFSTTKRIRSAIFERKQVRIEGERAYILKIAPPLQVIDENNPNDLLLSLLNFS